MKISQLHVKSQAFSSFYLKTVEKVKIASLLNHMHNESNDSFKEPLNCFDYHHSFVNFTTKGLDTNFTFRERSSNEKTKLNETLNIKNTCQNTIFWQRSFNKRLASLSVIY